MGRLGIRIPQLKSHGHVAKYVAISMGVDMADGDFANFITSERERLDGERQQLLHQQRELEHKLDAITKEFAAIEAYETAKTGKSARGGGASGNRPRTARRGSKREELMNVIRDGNGLSRGEILEKMGLKGD